MTSLALYFSRYVNGVAMKHGEVSRGMFPTFPINAITNGVHAPTWTSQPFQRLFDRHMPEWRRDNIYLRYARRHSAARDSARARRGQARADRRGRSAARGVQLDRERAHARLRAARDAVQARADLLFTDLERLRQIARDVGPAADRLRRQGAPARRRRQARSSRTSSAPRDALAATCASSTSRTTTWRWRAASSPASTCGSTSRCGRSRPAARAA